MGKIEGWTKLIDAPTKNGNGSTTFHKWRLDRTVGTSQGTMIVEIDDSESHGYAGGYVVIVYANRKGGQILAGKRTMQEVFDFAIKWMELHN